MGSNCAPFKADLFLFCYERDFFLKKSNLKLLKLSIRRLDILSTSRYLNDLLNIDNKYLDGLISQIYPSELQLNKANSSQTEASVLGLLLFILDGYISCQILRSTLEKSLSEKYVHIPGCQKCGAFHIGIQKNRVIHILFVEKRGPIIYLAALKKGAIRHAHPYYAI